MTEPCQEEDPKVNFNRYIIHYEFLRLFIHTYIGANRRALEVKHFKHFLKKVFHLLNTIIVGDVGRRVKC